MNLKDPRLRFFAAAMAILFAGAAAFAVGRYVLAEDAATEAQISPDATPDIGADPPHPEIVAEMTAVAVDNSKERFVGDLNGITFVGQETPLPSIDGCPQIQLQTLSSDEARSSIAGSELAFNVGDIPRGLTMTNVLAALCDGEVIGAEFTYEGSNGRMLSIGRVKTLPQVPTFAPVDRLSPMTIGKRNAVLVEPIGRGPSIIFMRDEEQTFWTINGEQISTEEVLKVAESIE